MNGRFKEPSTYAGAAGLILAALQLVPADIASTATDVVYGLAGLFGILAMGLREKGGTK
jgi:hypothetical protein